MKDVLQSAGIAGVITFIVITLGIDFVVISELSPQMIFDMLKISGMMFTVVFMLTLLAVVRS